jgi:hypothetical protein
VHLRRHKDHYTWNKPTTCVHNLLGGQRWVDHYGEVVIRNHSHGIKCKLTYAKVQQRGGKGVRGGKRVGGGGHGRE